MPDQKPAHGKRERRLIDRNDDIALVVHDLSIIETEQNRPGKIGPVQKYIIHFGMHTAPRIMQGRLYITGGESDIERGNRQPPQESRCRKAEYDEGNQENPQRSHKVMLLLRRTSSVFMFLIFAQFRPILLTCQLIRLSLYRPLFNTEGLKK